MSEVLDPAGLEPKLAQHRRELTGYCYRMLGSSFEAEDAVQETMVRAWRAYDRFEGRSSVRSWLYRIATNVCYDMLNGRQRRALPMDLGPAGRAEAHMDPPLPEATWIGPVPDSRIAAGSGDDPADVTVSRETVRIAFVAALQRLPARQRAVLILREVLRWKADEVADLLDTTVASVNSALQRARATLASEVPDGSGGSEVEDDDHRQDLLARYVEAFERFDVEALVALLHEDATFSMPPLPLWLQERDEVRRFYRGPGAHCEGSRMVPVQANGAQALAQYKPAASGDLLEPWAIHVLEVSGGQITAIHHFIDVDGTLFDHFGLPATLAPAADG